ncbi:MAG TPA: copper homeostasis protein CutC [Chitinophagaceae bacterium]|nr:copper homeostasis protein CutC [Chitinophagaceae bacterium]
MNQYCLEIATFTLDGALIAEKAGANRIELCENPNDGGTTPSYGTLKKAREIISIPIFPIIRPRGGDFVYSQYEFEAMKYDISLCKDLGYEGIVIGILDSDGHVDIERISALVALAQPMQVTFHRAFDRTKDAVESLEKIIDCGCSRILTSGQTPSVINGLDLIKDLIDRATDRIIIMPGSGLNSLNIDKIVKFTNAKEFHTAARIKVHHQEVYSPQSMNEELSYISVDETEVSKIRSILDKR